MFLGISKESTKERKHEDVRNIESDKTIRKTQLKADSTTHSGNHGDVLWKVSAAIYTL